MKAKIKIGTRGSKLALVQAQIVRNLLLERNRKLEIEVIVIKTKGDRILDSPLSKIGDKGLFTKELETALLDNEIDLAVHSLKDLPTLLPKGIILGGVLKREDVRDAFISKDGRKLSEMEKGSIIATSSLRRRSQLLALGKGFKIIDIRGNVDTRIRKMESGYCDGIVLACSGLIRSGLQDKISDSIEPELIVPAVSQGIIGIEIKKTNDIAAKLVSDISDPETAIMADAERAFLNVLEGGCQVPVGCFSRISGDEFIFTGMVSNLDGEKVITADKRGPLNKAVDLSISAAWKILDTGGKEILESIHSEIEDNHEN